MYIENRFLIIIGFWSLSFLMKINQPNILMMIHVWWLHTNIVFANVKKKYTYWHFLWKKKTHKKYYTPHKRMWLIIYYVIVIV